MAKKVKKVKVVRTPQGVRRVTAKRVPIPAQEVQAGNKNLVTIEDSTVKMIISDPRYTEAIPCLQNGRSALKSVKKRCGRCSRKRKQLQNDAMSQIKGCIAGLRGEQAKKFKELIGAKKVRVYQNAGRGRQPVPVTF